MSFFDDAFFGDSDFFDCEASTPLTIVSEAPIIASKQTIHPYRLLKKLLDAKQQLYITENPVEYQKTLNQILKELNNEWH
jgi:hypothetical protein